MKITYTIHMAKTASGFSGVLYFYLFIYFFIYFLEWAEHVNTRKRVDGSRIRKERVADSKTIRIRVGGA